MEPIETKKIGNKESLPWNLLLSADPSRKCVDMIRLAIEFKDII